MPDASPQTLAKLAERVIVQAARRKMTIATAESCTAGSLATLLADTPGASDSFHGAFVVYSKDSKIATLGVPPELISAHSAVSQHVAEAMATGVLARSPAQLAIAITGVAGPEVDEDGNPVGLVHVAVAARGGKICHRALVLGARPREEIRRLAMQSALEMAAALLDRN